MYLYMSMAYTVYLLWESQHHKMFIQSLHSVWTQWQGVLPACLCMYWHTSAQPIVIVCCMATVASCRVAKPMVVPMEGKTEGEKTKYDWASSELDLTGNWAGFRLQSNPGRLSQRVFRRCGETNSSESRKLAKIQVTKSMVNISSVFTTLRNLIKCFSFNWYGPFIESSLFLPVETWLHFYRVERAVFVILELRNPSGKKIY